MALMHELTVDLGDRSYPIYIGSEILNQIDLLLPHIAGSSALVVTNTTVAPLYLDALQVVLDAAGIRHHQVILDDGEQFKTLPSVERIIDTLLQERHDRRTTLIALGGGVVGDIAGFSASVYQRGVNFIQIPTTLLSQVDSSVGGKTGVNHPLGKNMIGAFYQPRCVIADIATLNTLPDRELSAGMAEVIKYGLIHDADFFAWLESKSEGLMKRESDLLAEAVLQSCRTKARVVELDERETGVRAILNLGHTFGHAIETTMGYGVWLHGEAVAAGMMMALDLSLRQGWIDQSVIERSRQLLVKCALPITPPAMTREQFLNVMAVDKKTIAGQINLVLLHALGEAFICNDYDNDKMMQTLAMK
ncbi:MAG: 3-dehydroquinate synthase [Gammaproteobacteria bacterium]|jgi:3-dehydroquinate synthase